MLIVTEAANLRQVLGGNSICQETHTHTHTAEQTESVPFVHLPTTDSWCGSANAPWSVAITDPIAAIPFPWPVSAQSWAWDVWCGAWAKSGLCPQQHAKITPFFFFLISGKKQKARIIQVLLKTARERLRLHSDTEHWAMSFFQWQQFRESSTRV